MLKKRSSRTTLVTDVVNLTNLIWTLIVVLTLASDLGSVSRKIITSRCSLLQHVENGRVSRFQCCPGKISGSIFVIKLYWHHSRRGSNSGKVPAGPHCIKIWRSVEPYLKVVDDRTKKLNSWFYGVLRLLKRGLKRLAWDLKRYSRYEHKSAFRFGGLEYFFVAKVWSFLCREILPRM